MDPFLRVIRNSQLFSGITEEELREMLGCLDVRRKRFQKGDFIFRTGDVTESLGLLLPEGRLSFRMTLGKSQSLFHRDPGAYLCRDVRLRGRNRDDGQCAGRFGL